MNQSEHVASVLVAGRLITSQVVHSHPLDCWAAEVRIAARVGVAVHSRSGAAMEADQAGCSVFPVVVAKVVVQQFVILGVPADAQRA